MVTADRQFGRGAGVRVKVWGFFNEHETDTLLVPAEKIMQPKTTMAERAGVMANLPGQMGLQVEIANPRVKELVLAAGTNRPLNQDEAVFQLKLLLEQARLEAGLTENLLDVEAGTQNHVYITNRLFLDAKTAAKTNAGIGFNIGFPPDLCVAFGLRLNQILTFNFSVVRTFELTIKDKVPDPFQGRYPINVIRVGGGEANSMIEGLGAVALVGTLNEIPPHISEGTVFYSDRTYLTVEFWDRARERVTFQDEYVMSMLLTFKSF